VNLTRLQQAFEASLQVLQVTDQRTTLSASTRTVGHTREILSIPFDGRVCRGALTA